MFCRMIPAQEPVEASSSKSFRCVREDRSFGIVPDMGSFGVNRLTSTMVSSKSFDLW